MKKKISKNKLNRNFKLNKKSTNEKTQNFIAKSSKSIIGGDKKN